MFLSDYEYDLLEKEFLEKYPDNKEINEVSGDCDWGYSEEIKSIASKLLREYNNKHAGY